MSEFTAQRFRDMKSNIFATRASIEDIIDQSSDTISVMIAVNTVLELLAIGVDEEDASAFDIKAAIAQREGGGE